MFFFLIYDYLVFFNEDKLFVLIIDGYIEILFIIILEIKK